MNNQKLILQLPNNKKLRQSFPKDPRGNIKITCGKNQYFLNKAHLRIQSSYLEQQCRNKDGIVIPDNIQVDIFDQVLSTLYGNEIQIDRSEVGKYYQVIMFLGLDNLLKNIREDVMKNIQQYDIFTIFRMAQKNSDQQLFQVCLEQLEKDQFNQLLYSRSQLMNLDIGLFRLVIKAHNKSKSDVKKSSQFRKIISLIQSYCQVNSISEQIMEEMIFSMVDISSLTASQFKSIFLKTNEQIQQTSPSVNKKKSQIYSHQNSQNKSNKSHKNSDSHDSSACDLSQLSDRYYLDKLLKKNISIHKLKLQNIYLHKKSKQLQFLNKNFEKEVSRLFQQSTSQQVTQRQIQNDFRNLKNANIQLKSNHKKVLNKYSHLIDRLQEQMTKKDERIQALQRYCSSLKQEKKVKKVKQQKKQEDFIVQSQFLPASFIHQMMEPKKQVVSLSTPQVKITQQPQEQLDEQQIQEKYMDRLNFVTQPITIQKKKIPILSKIIAFDGFNKKKLELIYRRSLSFPEKGTKQDIYNRNNLLFLIKTKTLQQVGWYIFTPLSKQKKIQDKDCFIFTITHSQKFRLQPTKIPVSIQIGQNNLISLSDSIVIPEQCLKEKSKCIWPEKIQQQLKGKGPGWFVGGVEFYICHIQVYEVMEEEMEMIL